MTVVNPKSISGINSITMASGSDDLLTIHSNNTTERVRVNSSGDVIVGSGVTLSPDGDIFATGITTVSGNVKVGTGITLSPDGDAFFTGVCTATSFVGALPITNDADNKIITSTGSGGLNAENNLNYNGTKLTLTGSSDSPVVEFINTSGSSNEGDVLKLRASGRGGGIDDTDIFLITNDSDTRTFGVSNAGTVNTTGNIVMTSGKGIDFSATANGGSGTPSEIFDDYEEGTWTPTVNGIASPNYTIQVGRYTKIGNLVNAQAYLLLYSGGGEGSNFRIASLPFTSTSTGYHDGGGYVTYENGFFSTTAGSAGATCTVWVPGNNTVIEFHERNSGNNVTGNSTNFGLGANNKYLVVQVQYIVA